MAIFSNQANSIETDLDAGNPTTNTGSATTIAIGESGGVFRGLIKWDLS